MEYTGADIKVFRERKGLTQSEFADLLGVDYRTIQNYESGKSIPNSKQKLIKFIIEDYENNVQSTARGSTSNSSELEFSPQKSDSRSIRVVLDNTLLNDRERMAQFVRFLLRNHDDLIKDELYLMYVGKIVLQYKQQKKKGDIDNILEGQ